MLPSGNVFSGYPGSVSDPVFIPCDDIILEFAA